LLSALDSIGVVLTDEGIAGWAVIVLHWPAPITDLREIARQMYESGRTMNQISDELGVPRWKVQAWLVDMPKRVGRGHAAPAEAKQRAVELVGAGLTQREAAEQVGISQSVISRRCIRTRPQPESRFARNDLRRRPRPLNETPDNSTMAELGCLPGGRAVALSSCQAVA
jgi:transposase-like protein